jgi:hypothetical protein
VSRAVQIDNGPVDNHLVFARVGRNTMQILNGVPARSKLPDDKVDIYGHDRLEADRQDQGCMGSRHSSVSRRTMAKERPLIRGRLFDVIDDDDIGFGLGRLKL